jgi:hypothetical protein
MILTAAGAMLIAMITARDLLRGFHIGKGRRISKRPIRTHLSALR